MDRSAPNPIPNSCREDEWEGGREGEGKSQRRRVKIPQLTIKTCLQGVRKGALLRTYKLLIEKWLSADSL